MMSLEIETLPALADNYIHLIRDGATGQCAAVDPATAGPVEAALERRGWTLTHILNTHHHADHTGANLALKARFGCAVVGARGDAGRIPGIDVAVADGDCFRLGESEATVLEVPGHTSGHIAFWFAKDDALFCGDTLFSLGCGRLFEGTASQMWASLLKLRALPDATKVFCAHEYTQANARFALSVDPLNPALLQRARAIDALRAQGQPTIPAQLGEEKAANPFLRADVLGPMLGMHHAEPVAVFAEIRRRKDVF